MFTLAQLQAIKAAINGDATAAAYVAADQFGALCTYMNSPASPVVNVWRPDITVSQLLTGVVWSEFLALTAAQQGAWRALTAADVDATNANIRAGFVSIFGASSQTIANLTAIAERPATRLEVIFTTASVTSQFGTTLSESDAHLALAS